MKYRVLCESNVWTVFAALNAFIIPIVYFFFPETAGRSLEGNSVSDVIFVVGSTLFQIWTSSLHWLTMKVSRRSRSLYGRMFLLQGHQRLIGY